MTIDEPSNEGEQAGASDAGIFSNLPDSRPSVRSPRRKTSGARRASSEPSSQPAPQRSTARRPRRASPPSQPRRSATSPTGEAEPQAPPPQPDHLQINGIEDLAWAGVAAAAQAATVGVRLASRALDAMREAVERR